MATSATRLEYRLTLSNVDRGVEHAAPLVLARHPSETAEHVTLRVLAFCLLCEERLEFGPGLSDPDAPDLVTRDLTGQITTWVECGAADPDKLHKVFLHHTDVAGHAVLCEPRRRDELLAGVATWKKPPRGRSELTVWMIDRALVAALAAREERRQKWTVTVVGLHAYVEADGMAVDGAIELIRPIPE